MCRPAPSTSCRVRFFGRRRRERGAAVGALQQPAHNTQQKQHTNQNKGYGPTAGAAICVNPNVDKLAFTGSTEVGRLVMREAAERIVPVTLELGGKSALIVDKNVDVDKAVEDAHFALVGEGGCSFGGCCFLKGARVFFVCVWCVCGESHAPHAAGPQPTTLPPLHTKQTNKFFNHGQCCAAGSRTFVHADIYDEFCAKAAARAERRVVGDPFDSSTEQGPQVDEDQMKKILSYCEIGQREGARLLCGGKRVGDKGYFISPTVFADVTDGMRIGAVFVFVFVVVLLCACVLLGGSRAHNSSACASMHTHTTPNNPQQPPTTPNNDKTKAREEIFGPVSCVLKYTTTAEVIKRANDSEYGLASGIISNEVDFVNTVSRALKCGTVWVNTFNVYER